MGQNLPPHGASDMQTPLCPVHTGPCKGRARNTVWQAHAQPRPDLARNRMKAAAFFAQMTARRPDMIAAEIPRRGHVPFLDEPAALDALARWLRMLG